MRTRKDINKLTQTSIDDIKRILDFIMKCIKRRKFNKCDYELSQSVYDRIIKDIIDTEQSKDITDAVKHNQSKTYDIRFNNKIETIEYLKSLEIENRSLKDKLNIIQTILNCNPKDMKE